MKKRKGNCVQKGMTANNIWDKLWLNELAYTKDIRDKLRAKRVMIETLR